MDKQYLWRLCGRLCGYLILLGYLHDVSAMQTLSVESQEGKQSVKIPILVGGSTVWKERDWVDNNLFNPELPKKRSEVMSFLEMSALFNALEQAVNPGGEHPLQVDKRLDELEMMLFGAPTDVDLVERVNNLQSVYSQIGALGGLEQSLDLEDNSSLRLEDRVEQLWISLYGHRIERLPRSLAEKIHKISLDCPGAIAGLEKFEVLCGLQENRLLSIVNRISALEVAVFSCDMGDYPGLEGRIERMQAEFNELLLSLKTAEEAFGLAENPNLPFLQRLEGAEKRSFGHIQWLRCCFQKRVTYCRDRALSKFWNQLNQEESDSDGCDGAGLFDSDSENKMDLYDGESVEV